MKADHYGLRDDIFKVAVCLQQFKALGCNSQAMAVKRGRDGTLFVFGWSPPNGVCPDLDKDVISCAEALQSMAGEQVRQVDIHFDGRGRLKILSAQRMIRLG